MWDVIRWTAAIMAFVARWVRWLFASIPVNQLDGIDYFEEPARAGVRARVPVVFEIGTKGGYSIFRTLAPGLERATGDASFDNAAYVQCNDPALIAALGSSERVRSTILQLFAGGTRIVSGDGRVLWIEGKRDQTIDDLHLLFELRTLLEAVELDGPSHLPHFGPRIAAVESVIWALAAYALGAFAESLITDGDLHVNPAAILLPGFLVALALSAFLFVLLYALLRRSPKGRSILSRQVGGVLVIVFLWAGVQLVSDLNRHLDSSNAVIIKRTIIRRESHPGRYGSHYWLYLSPGQSRSPVAVGSSLEVSEATFRGSFRSPDIELHLKSGWLGLPWYQSIVVGGVAGR